MQGWLKPAGEYCMNKHTSAVRYLLAAGLLVAAAAPASAGTCGVAVMDVYLVQGFSCTIGALQFSNFQWSTDFIQGSPGHSANLTDVITVTPQNGAAGIGFNFGNLGLGASGLISVTADGFNFDVSASSGTIVGASLTLGTHGATGTGTDTAYFQDNGSLFLLTVVDPIAWTGNQFYQTVRTTDSATFGGVTGISLFSGAGTVMNGADGNSSISDYTVLFQTSAPTSGVPEPATLSMLGAGIGVLGLVRRQRKVRR